MIYRYYKGSMKEADAAEFWAIVPDAVKPEVADVPAEAAA